MSFGLNHGAYFSFTLHPGQLSKLGSVLPAWFRVCSLFRGFKHIYIYSPQGHSMMVYQLYSYGSQIAGAVVVLGGILIVQESCFEPAFTSGNCVPHVTYH